MVTKQTDANTGDFESRLQVLEKRVAALEKLVGKSKKKIRRTREYTQEEKVVIRARLLAGQEEARKRREDEGKAIKKTKIDKSEVVKATETEKLATE